MHLCGHSSVKFLWSCDARVQDSFPLFLVNPTFPKYVLLSICAFIRVHFERPGKFSQRSPFRCTHIFQKLVMISEFFFSKKSWKPSLFKSMLVFQLDNLFFFFLPALFFFSLSFFFSLLALFFPYLLSSFLTCSLLLSSFFLFYFYFDSCLFYIYIF